MRDIKFLYALGLVTIIAAALSACVQSQSSKAADIQSESGITMPVAQTLSGNYLAGRFAQRQQDWDAAQGYMGMALAHDQKNDQMVQRTFLLALGAGNYTKARGLAEKIIHSKDGNEIALIFMSCDAITRNDFAAAISYLEQLPAEGFGQYTRPLLTAWSLEGMGKKEEALKLLAASASPDDPAYRIHAGMMEELNGNMNAASDHYKVAMENGLNMHTAVLIGNFYKRYGQPEITEGIYQGLDKAYPFNPFIGALMKKDPSHTAVPNITRAADGAALALFDLATLLYEKRAYDSAQIYGSMVQLLAPESPYTKLMMGDLAALHHQYNKAIESYNAVSAASPVFWLTRIRMGEVYEASGQLDQSVKMLTPMVEDPVTHVQALVALGDIYRRQNQFEKSIAAYDKALANVSPVTEKHWPIIYARGIAKERLNNWNLAEKDLLQALSFQPDNPMILNFIAYSWANQGIKLHKALEYAKQAVALRPDDGYILDSYGWTLFRLAKYKESIAWLEQAVEHLPNDSTLVDHLGDAYWQDGRHDEARYQWKHAEDLSQDAAFRTVMQQKLQNGILVPKQVAAEEH